MIVKGRDGNTAALLIIILVTPFRSDPELSQNTLDTLYACDALFFVSDTYALDERVRATPALRASTYLQPSLRLLAHFADKPGTRLLVNRTAIAGAEDAPDLSHVVDGLSSAESAEDGALDVAQAVEAAVGHAAFSKLQRQAIATASPALAAIASATDSAPAGIVPISAHAATRANEALRQALGPAPGPASEPAAPAARLWDQFRTLYTASNLAGVRGLVRAPPLSKSGPPLSPSQRGAALALQTAGFVLRHAVDEATEAALAAQAELRRAEGQAAVLASDVDAILSSLSQRILPSDGVDSSEAVHAASGAATRRRAGDRSKEKRGVLADSQGEVERTLSARLQWWKLPVKVDDVRAETEAAVERSFASKLEVQVSRSLALDIKSCCGPA